MKSHPDTTTAGISAVERVPGRGNFLLDDFSVRIWLVLWVMARDVK
jgi:hypothetical protein